MGKMSSYGKRWILSDVAAGGGGRLFGGVWSGEVIRGVGAG